MENSSFGRLISVLTSPGKTFESIRERPTWLVAFLAICLVSVAVGFIAHQRTDYRELMETKMTESGNEVDEDVLDQIVSAQENIGAYLIPVTVPLFIGGFVALLALIYWFGGKLTGAEPSFKQMYSMAMYSGAPGIVAALLQAIVLFPKEVLSYTQTATRNYLPAANLGFLAPDGASTKLISLLVGLDFFVIWGTILTFIGLKVVGRMSSTVAFAMAALIFLAGLGLRVAFA